jgi:hypothetical protein
MSLEPRAEGSIRANHLNIKTKTRSLSFTKIWLPTGGWARSREISKCERQACIPAES